MSGKRRWNGSPGISTARICALCIVCLAYFACGREPEVYGQAPSEDPPVSISAVLASPNDYAGKTVVLEGEAFDVCQHIGCFFSVDDGSGVLYVDLEEGRLFTVPKDLGGAEVVVEGVIVVEEDAEPYVIGRGVRIP